MDECESKLFHFISKSDRCNRMFAVRNGIWGVHLICDLHANAKGDTSYHIRLQEDHSLVSLQWQSLREMKRYPERQRKILKCIQ